MPDDKTKPNAADREIREYLNLFTDPKFAKSAFRSIIGQALVSPAKPLPLQYDKDGNVTVQSEIDNMAYQKAKANLVYRGIEREPMEAEVAMFANVIRMRVDNNAFVNMRDSTGAKPVDESKIDHNINEYSKLTDDELELLAQHRTSKEPTDVPEQITAGDNIVITTEDEK